MNHYISGILKIVLIEGSIALLLIDAVAQDRFTKARAWAHGLLAGLMVFGWANWGLPRGNIDVSRTLALIPIILTSGFAIGLAFSKEREERLASLKTWLSADVSRARTVASLLALVPGAAFGDDRWVRLSYAVSDAELEAATDRLMRFLGVPDSGA